MIKLEAEKKHKKFYPIAGVVLLVGLVGVLVFRYYLLRATTVSEEEAVLNSNLISTDLSLDEVALESLNNFKSTPVEKATTTPGNTNPFIVQ